KGSRRIDEGHQRTDLARGPDDRQRPDTRLQPARCGARSSGRGTVDDRGRLAGSVLRRRGRAGFVMAAALWTWLPRPIVAQAEKRRPDNSALVREAGGADGPIPAVGST